MAKRPGTREERKAQRKRERQAQAPAVLDAARPDPLRILGDIDAWNLRAEGGWWRFDARLEDGARAYLRPVAGGDIIADAPGPLLAVLAIGGPRRAGFTAGPPRFSHNVLAPADHIGAVGLEGTAGAEPAFGLQRLPHRSREALLADLLLSRRHAARRGLPLVFVRAETDGAASIAALAQGQAFANFCQTLDNLCAAATTLGRPARVLSVAIGFGAEDLTGDPAAFARDFRTLMRRIEAEMRGRGLAPPVFLADADCGTARIADPAATRAFWELAWCPGPHRLILPAPSYAAMQDRHGRPDDAGRQMLAEMDARALEAAEAREPFACPLPLLAEFAGRDIRVTFAAQEPLVVDAADPFGAGASSGFRVTGTDAAVAVLSAAPAGDDPRSLILQCDGPVTGPAPRLLHACALAPAADGRPANRSAIRDAWAERTEDGRPLHRWALPADLPLHPAPSGLRIEGGQT